MARTEIAPLLFAAGAALLAAAPAGWLVRTWLAPEYGSHGGAIALLALALAGWSLSGARRAAPAPGRDRAVLLVALTAAVRLAGQLLGVSVVGALALVVDVWALGLLAGLDRRRRPVSPGWLALLFAASFPVEFLARRTVGFGLQRLSADVACALLSLAPGGVACDGIALSLGGREILVDLPCSGARGILLSGVLFAALAALARPSFPLAAAGLVLVLVSALLANVVRIALLSAGVAWPGAFGGIDVMASPAHDAIGLATLALGCAPVLAWGRIALRSAARRRPSREGVAAAPANARTRPLAGALVFSAAAVAILLVPSRPLDVAAPAAPPARPAWIGGHAAEPAPLSPRERRYFERYGGGAAKARYGSHELLVVRTAAPLRHLHSPDECLAGAGYRVRYRGRRSAPAPAADYLATAPDGRSWQVAVTFVSDRGEIATSVGEAVWSWLRRPGATWTMVQRITPAEASAAGLREWETALARAFDLSQPPDAHASGNRGAAGTDVRRADPEGDPA